MQTNNTTLNDAAALVETVHIALQAIPDPALASLGRCLGIAHHSLLRLQLRTVADECNQHKKTISQAGTETPYIIKDGETILSRFKTKLQAIIEYAELLDFTHTKEFDNSKPFTLSHISPEGEETTILELAPTDYAEWQAIGE